MNKSSTSKPVRRTATPVRGALPLNKLTGSSSNEKFSARKQSQKSLLNGVDASLSPLMKKPKHNPRRPIGSDSTLLLAKRSDAKKWTQTEPRPRVLSIHDINILKNDHSDFSDEEEHKILEKQKLWRIDEPQEFQYQEYKAIRLPLEDLVINRHEHIRNPGNLYAILSTNLLKFEIFENTDEDDDTEDLKLLTIELQNNIHTMYYKDNKIFVDFKLSEVCPKRMNLFARNVELVSSVKNVTKWGRAYRTLSKIYKAKTELLSYNDVASKKARFTDKFANKDLKSLNRKGHSLGNSIGKPTSTSSLSGSSLIKKFYSPSSNASTQMSSYSPGRLTRSQLKGTSSSPEIIDDFPSTARPRRKIPREIFKPPLKYTFKDKIVFKIRDADFKCLHGGEWINDTLIDFFMKYYTDKAVTDGILSRSEYHVFSTFFFTKLKSSSKHYENIQRWVSKLDLRNTKFIILPINELLHWYCSIIYGIDTLINSPEGEGEVTIFVFDSLAQKHMDIKEPIGNFIIGYVKENFNKVVKPEQIELISGVVPKQPNFNDCGVHVIYNVSKFLSDKERCMALWRDDGAHWSKNRSFFSKTERLKMRDNLKQILTDLRDEQVNRGEVVSDDETAVSCDEDNDDIVYIDAEQFHGSKKASEEPSNEELEANIQDDKNIETPDIGSQDSTDADADAEDKMTDSDGHDADREEEDDDDGDNKDDALGIRSEDVLPAGLQDVVESRENSQDVDTQKAGSEESIKSIKDQVEEEINRVFFSSPDKGDNIDSKRDSEPSSIESQKIQIEAPQSQPAELDGFHSEGVDEDSVEITSVQGSQSSRDICKTAQDSNNPTTQEKSDEAGSPKIEQLNLPVPMAIQSPSTPPSQHGSSPQVDLMDVDIDDFNEIFTVESPVRNTTEKERPKVSVSQQFEGLHDIEDLKNEEKSYHTIEVSSGESSTASETERKRSKKKIKSKNKSKKKLNHEITRN